MTVEVESSWLHALGPARKVSRKHGKRLHFTVAEKRFFISTFRKELQDAIRPNVRLLVYYTLKEDVKVSHGVRKKLRQNSSIPVIHHVIVDPGEDDLKQMASRGQG